MENCGEDAIKEMFTALDLVDGEVTSEVGW
jgi:hypothetical protein